MEAPGESRIPTVRRSALPRPTSATPTNLPLSPVQYKPGFASLSSAHSQGAASASSPSAHLFEATSHLCSSPNVLHSSAQLSLPRIRLPSSKISRFSDSEISESPNRRAQRPASGSSRHSYPTNEGWSDEERLWRRDILEDSSKSLRASTESTFSRQLAKFTKSSNEDVSDPSLNFRVSTSTHGPRSCWEGPLHSVSSAEPTTAHLSRECVGKRVLIGGVERGTLRYHGRTAFAGGDWCGIELERAVGKNDGSVDGVIYFSCHPGHGIFAPAGKVFLDLEHIVSDDALSISNKNRSQDQTWQGFMPSSTHSQEANAVRRRPSDASSATYTIEGRDSSLPDSPESQVSLQQSHEWTQAKRSIQEDHEEDVASLGSPEDATCDESSLGILTPDQMPDFTVTASLGRSPSDEDVAALEDEVCDSDSPLEASARPELPSNSKLLRWDSDPSVLCVEELFKNDVSAIIRELRTSAEVSSSGGSSPTRPHPSPETERFQHDEEDMEELQKKEDEFSKGRVMVGTKEKMRKVSLQEECHIIPELREVPAGVDLSRLPAVGRRVAPLTTRLLLAASSGSDVPPEVEATWSNAAAAMTTSAGSLDQGYQGDAECDPRSEGGTGTASSPTEDVRFHGVIDVERLTEADVSLADDEGEGDHHSGVTARDRTARIIDGKLYHNHRDLGRAHDPHGSEMDSSGFYSDLDPRDRDVEDESTRADLEPVQEAQGNANLHDSLLDDQSHAQDDSTQYDHTFDDNSLKDELYEEEKGSTTMLDEEDRSSCSTLRPESKDLTPVENQIRTPSPSDNKQSSPSPNNSSVASEETKMSSSPKPNIEGTSVAADENKLTDSGIYIEGGEEGVKTQPTKPRTYDKPWLSKPPPPKKKEEPKKLMQPPPPMPKKNVQSKLKALLEAQEPIPEEARRPRQPRKNRWDEVMTKIAEGQKDEKVRPKIKEVKSRLMDGLKTQAQLSPQAERIRQERRERRERRERQAAVAAAAARRANQSRGDRKRSSASIRSNRTSRAPSLDSLPTDPTRPYSRGSTPDQSIASNKSNVDKLATTSRPVSPCLSDVSSSSDQSHTSNLSHVSSRLPIRSLHVSGRPYVGSLNSLCSTVSGDGGDSRGSRDSRILTSTRVNISNAEKKRSDASAPPRRPRLDNIKSTIPKPGRLPPRKLTDPVKAARPGGPTSGPRGPHHVGHGGIGGPGPHERQHVVPHAEQLRRLEAELTARATELKAARAEREHAERGVEALTVLIHHLTSNYEPFSCPRLKAEVVRLNQQLTDTRLSLDESTAAVRRLQEEAAQSLEQHGQKVQELEQRHRQALEKLTKQHQHDLDKAIEKHRKEMSKFAEEQQGQREDVSRAHAAELERLEGEWRNKLDLQHEKHLCAVQELNTNHTHKLRELETSRQAREFELEESNHRLKGEQEALKAQSRKLEESLLNDTDHRLQAVRNMCSSLKSEVDSLKTVVEMKNSEIHTLRAQVVEMGRLSKDLEVARDRAKSLQAKTEDLQAQMEKRSLSERHLVNEHRLLVETCQREANINKRLSLENEELAWKLRQREEMYTSLPSSTLDLVSRSPGTLRRQEGAPSPQAAPHSPRVAVRSSSGKISPSKCEVSKRRSRWGLSPEDGVNGDDRIHDVSIDSPPPSPCVKAVVEKSNSVSFILDLNDSQSDDSFLDLPPSPRPRPQRTASLSAADRPRTPIHTRRVLHNNRANSLNRNGKSDFNGKKKEVNGKSHDTNGHGSQPSSGRSASESSEGGEMERVSPTGLAWTVPVHSPKSPVKTNPTRQNGSPVRGRLEHHLLEDPDEDEYEETPEGTHQFIEVVELSRVGLSSSEAASDSELSQCDLIKGESSTESDSEESTDGDSHTQNSSHHEPLGRKNGPWCPKDGAGEAMITDEILKQYPGDPLPTRGKRPPRRCFPSAPSSDSDDNMNAHHEGTAVDVSWSEDITSSSEMHEL